MTEHTLAHALYPADTGCKHDMADIHTCVICNRWLKPDRDKVDTCSKSCLRTLSELQQTEVMGPEGID
jgi:hypothetical protein